MKIIKEEKWHYIWMEDAGEQYLTFMSGGPVEIDYSVKLTPAELQRIEKDPQAIDALIRELLSDHGKLLQRRIVPSKWPPRA